MIRHIRRPAVVQAQGQPPKTIEEFVGLANGGGPGISIAKMTSPPGWSEPGQTPEFDEHTVVLKGMLRVHTRDDAVDVRAGEAVTAPKGEWVRYETPGPDGAEYVSVCVPAFSPATVHRDE